MSTSNIITVDSTAPRSVLYPLSEAFDSGYLKVDDIHEIHYEVRGNKDGKPAVVLHGGPGGGCDEWYSQFFDPVAYKIVLFDQRGSGKSKPHACLENNTTWDLVEDIEKIRKHLGIDRWVVFGGSWGSTLALSYAQTYPDPIKALVLRGIFTLRRKELTWFYQEGASYLFPEAWDAYLAPIPEPERFDLMSAYHRRLTGNDEEVKQKCATAWTIWELSTSRLFVDPKYIDRADNTFSLAFARIENHYFVNAGFFKKDGQLIEDAHKISHIPGVIIQGRYDVVCPAISAYDLHKNWPQSELRIIPDAGHSAKEPGILSELVRATDKYKTL